ncbi:MAG: hypothetical protein KAR85_03765 [Methanosarcinales archaeon]|nr:hypothetical protein [Methanosarcinales archaeon]
MTQPSMEPIAHCRGVTIFAPESGKFSFMKSPFAAHTTLSAVDIYPGGGFGDTAPSPVDGTVIDIREYLTPTPFKSRDFKEYITAIKQGDSVVKILHMKPAVNIGDTISAGDPLGILVHNGYFYFWNEPPLHVEVRQQGDYIRASNHNPLKSCFEFSSNDTLLESTLPCRVVFSDERFTLLKGGYDGQKVKGYRLGGCLIDGLIPMEQVYDIDYFGLIGLNPPCEFMRAEGNRYMVSTGKVRAEVLAGGYVECRAIAFSLSHSVPTIKVIPKHYGQKLFNVGDEVIIKLSLC